MQTHRLIAHQDHPPEAVAAVAVQWVEPGDGRLHLRYRVDGFQRLVIPAFAGRGRADGLWRTTCFELFVGSPGDAGYAEFNFSPSQRWAAYDFDAYRAGMRERSFVGEPVCEALTGDRYFVQDIRLDLGGLPLRPWRVGLAAVLEERGGARSYWALAHPPGAPDFHHDEALALILPGRAAA